MKKTFLKGINIFAQIALISYISGVGIFVAPSVVSSKVDIEPATGSIWTTKNDCGDVSQDVNHYDQGEDVWINGANFAPGIYDWNITGQPGNASGDPNEVVASGQFTVGDSRVFCFNAYTVAGDDWGEYGVTFGNKHDNYRVSPLPVTINAHKIVCSDEAELPNWGAGGPNITATTAQDWVNQHASCEFQPGWTFQWNYQNTSNPGDNTGVSTDWFSLDPTDGSGMTMVEIPDLNGSSHLWFREAWNSDYIRFTYNDNGNNSDNYSAEVYCHTDVLNYDNYDRVDGVAPGGEYYCVGFNVLEEPPFEPPEFNFNVNKDDGQPVINPDGSLTYTIAWNGVSYYALPNVVITDYLPDNVTFVEAVGATYNDINRQVVWELGTIIPTGPDYVFSGSGQVTVNVNSPLDSGTEILNTGNFCWDADLNVDNVRVRQICHDFTDLTVVESDFELDLVKTDLLETVEPGANLTYTIDWTVTGDAPAYNATLEDVLPAEVSFNSASDGGVHDGSATGGLVSWTLGDLNPGDMGSVTIEVTVLETVTDQTDIFNEATFSAEKHILVSEPEGEPEVEIVSVSASASDTTLAYVSVVPTEPVGDPEEPTLPEINLVKDASATNVTADATVVYTLNYTVSENTAQNLILTDPLPDYMSFVAASNEGSYDVLTNMITWDLGDKAPGNYIVTVTTQIDKLLPNNTVITNIATLQGNELEPVTDSAEVTVATRPVLVLQKIVDQDSVTVDQTLLYTLRLTNEGNDVAQNVVINDVLPEGFVTKDTSEAAFSINFGNVDPGKSVATSYEVEIDDAIAAGDYDNVATAKADNADPVTSTATVTVEKKGAVLGVATEAEPEVLGAADELTETGAGLMDFLFLILGAAAVLFGVFGLRQTSARMVRK